jgi:hypothetical protein
MAELKRKRRDIITPVPSGKSRTFNLSTKKYTAWKTASAPNIMGSQVTDSEGHPFQSRVKRGYTGDIGGEFFTFRQQAYLVNDGVQLEAKNSNLGYIEYYDGPLIAADPSLLSFPTTKGPNRSLVEDGATAISRCKPTNTVANASTFLGELLKDGIPGLPLVNSFRDRALHFRNSGDEFLNVEFGWLPFVSDVRSFAHAVSHAHSVLEQFERDSGKLVRRRYSFPIWKESSETIANIGRAYGVPMSSTLTGRSPTDLYTHTEYENRRWFSGAFTYHMDSGNSPRAQLQRFALEADKLLGIQLTPSTLWELAPWSWAIDWFSNAGDVISNLSDWSTYGLVLHHGYMMENSIAKRTYSRPDAGLIDRSAVAGDVVLITESKRRIRANPFGFGLTWEGLNPLQLAIAAALGISRL